MTKFLWVDTETTGTDPEKHEIAQLAGMAEVPGSRNLYFNFKMRPLKPENITEGSIKVHGISKEKMLEYPHLTEAYLEFKLLLNGWVNCFIKEDKFIIGGQNDKV